MSSDEPLRHPESFPTELTGVLIRGPVGDLEALTDVPEEDAGIVAVVCHDLSEDGGSLHGKVEHMIERSMREMGACTVRFNSRGTGASEGEFNHGVGEAEDLIHVVQWAQRVLPDRELWLGGFGFGAYVAARAAQQLPVRHLVTVAPPVERMDFASLPRPDCHWLVIQGDLDSVTNPDAVYQWAESLDEPPQLIRMQDTDHQFHRRLMDLRGVIKNGIRRQVKAEDETEDA